MMGITHMVFSATATSLILGTANPAVVAIAASAGLFPDIDVSTSTVGRMFPWIANWFERRFPHRSCTHSLLATAIVAAVTYAIVFVFRGRFLQVAHAITMGYFFGWFADVFTKSGVEMLWPAPERYVCPSNRNFRIKTGSRVETGILVVLVILAVFIFNMNASGGLLTHFNRLMATPSGVEVVYNRSGSNHLITAHIKGVRAKDRSSVAGDFIIIEARGHGFIVQSPDKRLYKAGTDPSAQIITEHITADVSRPAITNIEPLTLDDDHLISALETYNRPGAMVFVSGQISIDDPDGVKYTPDPYQFPYITVSGSSLNLETAPLSTVLTYFGDQYCSGQLQIRIINETTTNPSH
ncbi:metal-dependent hydrolase [Aetokthonos hydrillicola Thurmond2011]|jgi:inner membrane protein|uniref:Metal-dependent hydrolase n=1 Tax=Aetokthonos hydrillicola Thurmond2011 TaxID=2712845 RepID=A0AAP5M5R9_9CYAN|nr:metal-dependent hydrolase [Aetokthonos hydrillicola]MBO3463595.1 metal-dependent hydrolase [Aetokthonos hydrillicola CCALA 1050]MBW4591324.1 metal-dependent hydrolase [Aetokthonos hydrillicola CCALA 1050]MDR9896226.1 metal-dependent hydrolase [Aetokthonos hydrillicola Thurmond2011]